MAAIRCRSKKTDRCLDGKPESSVYGDGTMADDGTWDGQTVVCDSCYLGLGQPGIPVDHPDAPGFGASIDQGDPRAEAQT